MQLHPFSPSTFLSPRSCLPQDRRGQTGGGPLLEQMMSPHQRSRTATFGGLLLVRGRWPSQTSPSTPSQWLSESPEWPKVSSETGAWRSDCVMKSVVGGGAVCLVFGGQGWCFHFLSALSLTSYFQPGEWYVYMHRVTELQLMLYLGWVVQLASSTWVAFN